MAIPRVFNSNTPFIIVAGGSELSFLGKEDDGHVGEEEKESLVQAIAPHLSRVMQRGTAKHVVPAGQEVSAENPCVSIVAQAEREDFQEFSPTTTQRPYSRSQQLKKLRSVVKESSFLTDTEDEDLDEASKLPLQHLQRKQRRKTGTRQSQEDGEQRPVIRGLWVQEIDWLKSVDGEATSSTEVFPPPPEFTDSCSCSGGGRLSCVYDEICSCTDVCDCVRGSEDVSPSDDQYGSIETDDTSSSGDRGASDSDCSVQDLDSIRTHESDSDSSCCADDDTPAPESFGVEAKVSNSTFDLLNVSGFNSCPAQWDSDSTECAQSLLGLSDSVNTSRRSFDLHDFSDLDAVVNEMRGRVTQMPKQFVPPFFKDFLPQTLNDWKQNVPVNEGLIFHQRLQPSGQCEYREGEDYFVLHHIQNGSYGDVFCVRDQRTGFECAAKRIPLSHFSREEVSTWSALNSPRVVELFGAVREGLNVVLFMDLKPACLAQLLKEMTSLPEDLALYYLHQSLGALEHLHHRKVLHLDVKVDNVLLSADCRDTFLCDFGLSETLDDSGQSTKAFRVSVHEGAAAFPGTETHMAPEVARGDGLCAKADVWSSCCMLLHMLNGCHPWIRYYSHPLCLQIVNEPPPLWEVPSTCNNFTAKVFRAGLKKDPDRRASAKELRRKTTKALRAGHSSTTSSVVEIGGLSPCSVQAACEVLHCGSRSPPLPPLVPPNKPSATASAPMMHWVSPWRTTAVEEDLSEDSDVEADSFSGESDSPPKSLRDENDWDTGSESDVDIYMGEEDLIQEMWTKMDRDYEGDWEEEGREEEEDEEWESSVSTDYLRALRGLFPLLQKGQQAGDSPWGSEPELEHLRDADVALGTTFQTPSPEPRDDPPSCFSSSDTSQMDASGKDSDHSSDDLSSGVFSSCNSHTDGRLEWSASAKQPSSCCFEAGVDIWIENVQGQCLRIRERRQVKVGHVALGISEQISGKPFTLETLDRKLVSFEEEITESCVWLRCVSAPDTCHRWSWRVRDGRLELQS
nr:PREDICTED: mitogen-activated protein kinase kinase kinase 14-like isoform X1 [Paralichthys olivaceus]XP_019966417.1 PREDICTED: mitogen-activated protein kinase kinase kinase 14-like isoform X1 [Paralichthys olivaceus]XP_019966418.1 PREDICTED: mitogen-activated protein kinase kinase kinase 14-like isoform X1 [Paralichthys olivaceus]